MPADGSYSHPDRRPALSGKIFSQLRKEAALRGLPPGRRGRKPTYGRDIICLAKPAGHRQGGRTETLVLYGRPVTKTYQTFLATWRPAGGVIRVVLVQEDDG